MLLKQNNGKIEVNFLSAPISNRALIGELNQLLY